MDTTQEIIEEIAQAIINGFTSGRVDSEDGTRTSWSIDIETWKD